MNIEEYWNSIGDIGKEHCRNAFEIRSTRISNLISASGAFLIFIYFLASCLEFQFRYQGYLVFQLSLVLIMLLNLALNHIGFFMAARTIGVLSSIVYVVGLNMIAGNQMGGAYMLLVTSLLPMILFEKRWQYSLFFLLHILAFFVNYYYQQNYEALIEMAAEEIPVAYCSAVLVMFISLFLIMQHFLQTNREFERDLTLSKRIIEDRNRNILDSIEYAGRIQGNILPPLQILKEFLPDSFVLFRPKDIVSGDFYWFYKISGDGVESESKFLIAACDCTGHGVPGALVSVVCSTALNKAVGEFGLTDPGTILDKVNVLVASELGKNSDAEEVIPDGMDISLCRLDLKNRKVSWAGAQNPLWILRDSEIIEFKPDKKSIGNHHGAFSYAQQEANLKPGDSLFMFSDGFADQFGGPAEKKISRQGFRRMLISATGLEMKQMKGILENGFDQWKGSNPQVDDVCVIGIRI